jgi:uncharacterized cupin superfamily protein
MTGQLRSPALDPLAVQARKGSAYPEPFKGPVEGRSKRALGDALGLANYGVNHVRLEPGAWSAQRHWHSHEDEFVYILEGEITLITEQGEKVLTSGMAAGFPAGVADGHHLVNKSDRPAAYLEIGDRLADDEVHYPDIDLFLRSRRKGRAFTDKKGAPYR